MIVVKKVERGKFTFTILKKEIIDIENKKYVKQTKTRKSIYLLPGRTSWIRDISLVVKAPALSEYADHLSLVRFMNVRFGDS
jgi:hypothetical protein